MPLEETRETMSAYLDALMARSDFAQFFADDVLWITEGAGQEVRGREGVEQLIRYLHEQAFDGRMEMRNLIVVDRKAALEANFVGRHIAEFAGVPPSGRPIDVPYAVLYDLAGDKITALRAYLPMDELIRQISGTPEPATASA